MEIESIKAHNKRPIGEEICLKFMTYTMILLFILIGLSVVFVSFYILPVYKTEIVGFVLNNKVSHNSGNYTIDRNTIYIFDEDTRCTKSGACMTASVSPFSDTTDVIKAIHHADPILPIHVIISTAGGSLVGCKTILRHLRKHPAGYIVYCNEAYSAGSILSISSDQIVMDEYSHLGKIDPSFGGNEAIILKQLYHLRTSENTTSYLTHDMLRSISLLNSLEKMLKEFVPNYSNMETTIRDNLIYSNLSHFESFNYDEMRTMGFNVRKPESHELIYFGYFQAK